MARYFPSANFRAKDFCLGCPFGMPNTRKVMGVISGLLFGLLFQWLKNSPIMAHHRHLLEVKFLYPAFAVAIDAAGNDLADTIAIMLLDVLKHSGGNSTAA